MIKITDNAILELRNTIAKSGKQFARLEIKGGGCAGFEYEWSTTDQATRNDMEIEGVLLIDRMFELYLLNMELDYFDDGFNKGFKFNNPNAKASCGCGTSFSI